MFGGFGGLSDADFKTIPDTPKPAEKKEQPDLSVGWGSFGAADVDNMLNSAAGLQFGE